MVTEDRSRGQVILIGAIALAFIILGVVVVFNGVLYTETLSSGSTSQSANTAEVTAHEVKQGIACVPESERGDFAESYQNVAAESMPAAVEVKINGNEVTIEYDSQDLSYEETLDFDEIDVSCPGDNS